MEREIAVFDFDGTLTTKDTFIEFAKWALGTTRFILALILSLPYLVAWKLHFISSSKAKQKLFSRLFKDMPRGRFKQLGEQFSHQIDTILRQEVLDILREHQSRGAECYIISASIEDWIEPWALANGFKAIAATRVEYSVEGRLTGNFSGVNCLGLEKLHRLAELVPNYKDCEMWAYGDSKQDIPLLQEAQHGVRV